MKWTHTVSSVKNAISDGCSTVVVQVNGSPGGVMYRVPTYTLYNSLYTQVTNVMKNVRQDIEDPILTRGATLVDSSPFEWFLLRTSGRNHQCNLHHIHHHHLHHLRHHHHLHHHLHQGVHLRHQHQHQHHHHLER